MNLLQNVIFETKKYIANKWIFRKWNFKTINCFLTNFKKLPCDLWKSSRDNANGHGVLYKHNIVRRMSKIDNLHYDMQRPSTIPGACDGFAWNCRYTSSTLVFQLFDWVRYVLQFLKKYSIHGFSHSNHRK